MARLTIRVDFESGAQFGPGKARLLEAIESTGSIRKAAASLRMSYRRAWLLLQAIEDAVQERVTLTEAGGRDGGGTKLTAPGRKLLKHYRAMERHAARAAAKDLRALSALTKPRARAKRSGR
ncbi:MAG: LysR family transcriptional regulator [Proteobacteria bacterium]|nr:LysR family transcriptional regulator [Pseudomonadota bacterium]